jgi:transcriptional regulator
VTDPQRLCEFIDQHGFATLVTQIDGEPWATHLPLMWESSEGKSLRLVGHVAVANAHATHLSGQRALAIFHGPHAYISPGWMGAQNVVPTWNYVAVHVYGTVRVIEDAARLRNVLEALVKKYEETRSQPWQLSTPESDFLNRMQGGIVGFELVVDRIEGKWKLSQNHPVERREGIIQGLLETGRTSELEIAHLMQETLTI